MQMCEGLGYSCSSNCSSISGRHDKLTSRQLRLKATVATTVATVATPALAENHDAFHKLRNVKAAKD
ncbi:hypothetical protein ACLKA6_005598 [Drosophila palustris]